MGKKKKPKPKASPPLSSKLIVPGAETGRKSQLLVPGDAVGKASTRLSIPGVEPPTYPPMTSGDPPEAESMDQMTVINEDTGESVTEDSQPVRVTAMVPPPAPPEGEVDALPIEDEPAEPIEPVAMSAPTEPGDHVAAAEYPQEAEQVYEGYQVPADDAAYQAEGYDYQAEGYAYQTEGYAEQGGGYAEQTGAYGADQVEGGWEQPAEQPYDDPTHYAPAPVPAPSLAPPRAVPPMPYAQPTYGYAPPPGYGPPPGYRTQGMMPGQMYPGNFAPARNVPSWALILVGVLVGFLGAMVIFKFTGMGAALRGDLIEEGRQKAAKKYEAELKQREDDGDGEGGVDEGAKKEPDPAGASDEGNGSDPAEGDGGGAANPDITDGDGAEPDDADGDALGGEESDADASGPEGTTTEVEFDADIPDPSEGTEEEPEAE